MLYDHSRVFRLTGRALFAVALTGLPLHPIAAQRPGASVASCESVLARDSILRTPPRVCELSLKRDPYAFNTRYFYFYALKKAGLSGDAARIMEEAIPLFRDSLGQLGTAVKLLTEERGAEYTLRVLTRRYLPDRDSTEARAIFAYALADSLRDQIRPTIDSVLEQTPHSRTGLRALLRVLWYQDKGQLRLQFIQTHRR